MRSKDQSHWGVISKTDWKIPTRSGTEECLYIPEENKLKYGSPVDLGLFMIDFVEYTVVSFISYSSFICICKYHKHSDLLYTQVHGDVT